MSKLRLEKMKSKEERKLAVWARGKLRVKNSFFKEYL